jgi:hypothetical protein
MAARAERGSGAAARLRRRKKVEDPLLAAGLPAAFRIAPLPGPTPHLASLTITNTVYKGDFPVGLDAAKIRAAEASPMRRHGCTLLLFASGRFVVTGGKTIRDVQACLDALRDVVQTYVLGDPMTVHQWLTGVRSLRLTIAAYSGSFMLKLEVPVEDAGERPRFLGKCLRQGKTGVTVFPSGKFMVHGCRNLNDVHTSLQTHLPTILTWAHPAPG